MDDPKKIITTLVILLSLGLLCLWVIAKIDKAGNQLKESTQERTEVMVGAIEQAEAAKKQLQDAQEKHLDILKEAGIDINQ